MTHCKSKKVVAFFALLVSLLGNACLGDDAKGERFFEEKVRPLLVEHCLECHNSEVQENGFRLDSRAAILKGSDNGLVVSVGEPGKSRLIQALRGQGDLEKMPPDVALSSQQVQDLVRWIKLDLPWSVRTPLLSASLSQDERLAVAKANHWSYQPVARPEFPKVVTKSWPTTGVDYFVLAKLESVGIAPSPRVDRRTLIRRVTFDLLGLPPTPQEVEDFLNDERPDAYPRLVDRLLASPRYGERWGRHWLDVARYADTKGYAFGRERRFAYAYTYRDYAIQSLNADKPYDRFLLEQLAADLLPDRDSSALAGLGLLTVGRRFNNRHDDIDDQIDVVGRGLLGLTISCARCHDHKYDAIPTEDYYSMYGIFASCSEPPTPPLIGDPTRTPGYDRFKAELDKRQDALNDFLVLRHSQLIDHARQKIIDYLVRAVSTQPEKELQKLPFVTLKENDLRPRFVERWKNYLASHAKPDHPVLGSWHQLAKLPEKSFSQAAKDVLGQIESAEAGLSPGQVNPLVQQALRQSSPHSMHDVAHLYGRLFTTIYEKRVRSTTKKGTKAPPLSASEKQIGDVAWGAESPTSIPRTDVKRYFNRADRNREKELQKKIDSHRVDAPGAPARAMAIQDNAQPFAPRVFIRGNHARLGKHVPRQFVSVLSSERHAVQQGSGRLELARAIASPQNPLTRRVIVNRLWLHHMVDSLVDTPSDFGQRCARPEQFELLDYLAWYLEHSNWSLKALHRQIVLASTYCQASQLRVACAQRDPENKLFWRMNRRRLEYEAVRDALFHVSGQLDSRMHGRPVNLLKPPFAGRRAVYGFIDRQDLPNLLRVFDFASPDQSSARRPHTTVPQQALFMMNSHLVIARARALTERVAAEVQPADKIQALYHLLFARPATEDEVQIGLKFIGQARENEQVKLPAWDQYAQLLLLTNEFMFID